MSFISQKTKAKASYLSNRWKNERTSSANSIRSGSLSDLKRVTSDKHFGVLANQAYKSKHGYAIRTNKRTGEKEMFVRGTTFRRGGVEWLQNLAESPLSSMVGGLGSTISSDVSRHIRRKYSKFLSDVARKEKVDVIYGHSRGAAVVEDMRVPGAVKLGIDGATILNQRSHMKNYRQKQAFDAVIGWNARSTIRENKWTPVTSKRYHRVWSK